MPVIGPQGEFGHLVLLAMFDCVDDTKLVKQAVLSVSLKPCNLKMLNEILIISIVTAVFLKIKPSIT